MGVGGGEAARELEGMHRVAELGERVAERGGGERERREREWGVCISAGLRGDCNGHVTAAAGT